MIQIRCGKTPSRLKVKAEGHALFAPSGQDPVCASVSVLLQSWLASEEVIAGASFSCRLIKPGFLEAEISPYTQEQDLLYTSLLLGLGILEKQYPQNLKVNLED